MDEMDEYRERIERRYKERRHKNDRRVARAMTRKMIDLDLVVIVVVLVGFAAMLLSK